MEIPFLSESYKFVDCSDVRGSYKCKYNILPLIHARIYNGLRLVPSPIRYSKDPIQRWEGECDSVAAQFQWPQYFALFLENHRSIYIYIFGDSCTLVTLFIF